jgi:hypothetical protein
MSININISHSTKPQTASLDIATQVIIYNKVSYTTFKDAFVAMYETMVGSQHILLTYNGVTHSYDHIRSKLLDDISVVDRIKVVTQNLDFFKKPEPPKAENNEKEENGEEGEAFDEAIETIRWSKLDLSYKIRALMELQLELFG